MLKSYPKLKRGEVDKYYKKLSKVEREVIDEYLVYRKARGVSSENKLNDVRRYILHFRMMIDKPFVKVDLKDLREVLIVINGSYLTDATKNNVKTDIKNFLKNQFRDWSMRFNDFDEVRLSSNSLRNEEKINAQNMFSISDIEKCMKHETKNFWKAFFMLQYEGALRTKESRCLRWDNIKFNVDGDISEIQIFATKTKRARTIFVEKATFYLQKIREEQENTGKSIYCFPSKKNINKPVSKDVVSKWFRRLTENALGSKRWNYLLRHSRATELYRLAEQGKISKDVAIRFMGHSSDMSKSYTHLDSKEIKKMLKDQVYKIEDIPEESKHELELKIEELKEDMELMDKKHQTEMEAIHSTKNKMEDMFNKTLEMRKEIMLHRLENKK